MSPTNSISFVGLIKGKQLENDKDYSFFEKSISFKKYCFFFFLSNIHSQTKFFVWNILKLIKSKENILVWMIPTFFYKDLLNQSVD